MLFCHRAGADGAPPAGGLHPEPLVAAGSQQAASGGPACGAHFLEFTTAFSLSKTLSLRGWGS